MDKQPGEKEAEMEEVGVNNEESAVDKQPETRRLKWKK